MTDKPWKDLYDSHSDRYDQLVRAEDHEGRLLAAVSELARLEKSTIVELGAGTGRITVQLLPYAARIHAFDLTPAMIHRAADKLKERGSRNACVAMADSRSVPVPDGCADLSIEGWSFLQIMVWNMESWRAEVGKAVSEMLRVLRPGGTAILIETLGTGETAPNPPPQFLPVYEFFEREWGFSLQWIRTDYLFSSMQEARQVVAPIFGETMLERCLETDQGIVLPECTGIWSRKV